MGLLSALGGLGAAIAAPFTGGTSLAWLPGLIGAGGALGDVLAGGSKGAAQERGQQNLYTSDRNRAQASMYGTQQGALLRALENLERGKLDRANLDMDQRTFALNAPTTRARQSVQGSAMANAQDASISGLPPRIQVPNISGGLRPSMMGGDTRELGRVIMAKTLADQMKGDTFEAVPEQDFKGALIDPPTLEGYAGPGKFETAGSTAGVIGGILKAIELLTKKKPQAGIDPGFENRGGQTIRTPIIPGSVFGG